MSFIVTGGALLLGTGLSIYNSDKTANAQDAALAAGQKQQGALQQQANQATQKLINQYQTSSHVVGVSGWRQAGRAGHQHLRQHDGRTDVADGRAGHAAPSAYRRHARLRIEPRRDPEPIENRRISSQAQGVQYSTKSMADRCFFAARCIW